MEDISNRTLATLLIAAIVISVFGTIISINRLSQISGIGGPIITGMATNSTGQVNVVVQTSMSVKLNNNTVNFGVGYINASDPRCNNVTSDLVTNGWPKGTNVSTNNVIVAGIDYANVNYCWVNSTCILGVSRDANCRQEFNPLMVENDGTINVSLRLIGNKNNQSLLGDGNATAYLWRLGGGQCKDANASGYKQFFINNTVCGNLDYIDGMDKVVVDVYLAFPTNQTGGAYTDSSIIFDAASIRTSP